MPAILDTTTSAMVVRPWVVARSLPAATSVRPWSAVGLTGRVDSAVGDGVVWVVVASAIG